MDFESEIVTLPYLYNRSQLEMHWNYFSSSIPIPQPYCHFHPISVLIKLIPFPPIHVILKSFPPIPISVLRLK